MVQCRAEWEDLVSGVVETGKLDTARNNQDLMGMRSSAYNLSKERKVDDSSICMWNQLQIASSNHNIKFIRIVFKINFKNIMYVH
jgi:hypothetical protein